MQPVAHLAIVPVPLEIIQQSAWTCGSESYLERLLLFTRHSLQPLVPSISRNQRPVAWERILVELTLRNRLTRALMGCTSLGGLYARLDDVYPSPLGILTTKQLVRAHSSPLRSDSFTLMAFKASWPLLRPMCQIFSKKKPRSKDQGFFIGLFF